MTAPAPTAPATPAAPAAPAVRTASATRTTQQQRRPGRIVVDATVLAGALARPGGSTGRVLWEALADEVELLAPEPARGELVAAMVDGLGLDAAEVDRILAALPVEWVEAHVYADAAAEAEAAVAHPADAPAVACALALGTDLVSGYRDLHDLREPVVRTWTPDRFVEDVLGGA